MSLSVFGAEQSGSANALKSSCCKRHLRNAKIESMKRVQWRSTVSVHDKAGSGVSHSFFHRFLERKALNGVDFKLYKCDGVKISDRGQGLIQIYK